MSTSPLTQPIMEAQKGLARLQAGNRRFLQAQPQEQDFPAQVVQTAEGQSPFAVILSCADSRLPVEILLDQGLGDLFTIRIAGNVVNADIIASVEYGCSVIGVPLVIVMGHTRCGAVEAACNGVQMGHITQLLDKIQPAVATVAAKQPDFNAEHYDAVAYENVRHSAHALTADSTLLHDLHKNQALFITGAVYDVRTGSVDFFPISE